MTLSPRTDPQQDLRRRRTVTWVVGLATLGLMFDGYDLVVYGTVVSTFLRNPNEIGQVTPAAAGALGSYALVGVLVGALAAGAVGDIIGRRKVMLVSYAWFAVFMGGHRAVDGHDDVRDRAVPDRHRRGRAGGHDGRDRRGVRATGQEEPVQRHHVLRRPVRQPAGRAPGHPAARTRSGGAACSGSARCPLVTLLPLAFFKMPESVAWLVSRGRIEEARRDVRANGHAAAGAAHPLPQPTRARRKVATGRRATPRGRDTPGCSTAATGCPRCCSGSPARWCCSWSTR